MAKPALLWFLSEPEYEVARGLAPLPEHVVTGAGVEVPASYDAQGFRRRHHLDRPFVLYAGRREPEKGGAAPPAGLELPGVRAGPAPVPPPHRGGDPIQPPSGVTPAWGPGV